MPLRRKVHCMAAASSAADGRHTHCLTIAGRVSGGRHTITLSPLFMLATTLTDVTKHPKPGYKPALYKLKQLSPGSRALFTFNYRSFKSVMKI